MKQLSGHSPPKKTQSIRTPTRKELARLPDFTYYRYKKKGVNA